MELQDWTARSPYLIPFLAIPTCGSNPASDRSRSVAAAAAAVVWFVAPLGAMAAVRGDHVLLHTRLPQATIASSNTTTTTAAAVSVSMVLETREL
jgi:hypothetical protein